MRFCHKTMNKERKNTNTKDDSNFTLIMHYGVYFKSVCKLIIDLGATNHMISYRTAFDTCKVIAIRNVYLAMIVLSKPLE